jgi:hypothetical protein
MNLIHENHKILEKEEWLLKGDYNTNFSHKVANGKKGARIQSTT